MTCRRQQFSSRGYTLPEFLFTLLIISVLALLATAGIGRLRASITMNTNINNLIHMIHEARSRALVSGSAVVICPTQTGSRCDAGAAWHDGWLAFQTTTPGQTQPPSETNLLSRSPRSTLRINANRRSFVLRPFGRRSTNGTLVFCDPQSLARARAVVISYTGKPRLSQRDASGRPLTCGSA